MTRFLLALCLTFCGGILLPASSVLAQGMSAPSISNVTGDWKANITGAQLIVGTLHITQVGETIVGSGVSPSRNGVLQISGKLVGNKISGNWRGPTGEVGWITLTFQSDSAFSGEWGYGGRSPSGHIVAQKVRSSSF